MASGWTYDADLPQGVTVEQARDRLAELWGGTRGPGNALAIHVPPSVDVIVEQLLDDDEHDVAIDFYGPTGDVEPLAAALSQVFARVSGPVWA